MNLNAAPSTAPVPMPGGDVSDTQAADGELSEAALWSLCRDHADQAARQRLLNLHLPYARVVAASYYAKRLHDEIEFGDYHQLASLGLIEAFERFDPAVGVQFKTFAARRMHGAILDGVEQLTEKQQQIAARQRLEAQRRAAITEAATGGDGARRSTAGARNSDQVLKFVAEAGLAFALAWILDGTGMLNSGEKAETLPFYRSVELQQLRQRIADLVNSLPSQERRVIQSHYFQELAFEEIAQTLRLSRARISQIHRQGLLHLRDALRAQQDCDVSW